MAASTSSRRFIDALVEELSISDTRYEQANDSYQSLGRWLNRPDSTIAKYNPTVYVQGSFGLGTVIKPLNLDEEYDIDAVCELKLLDKASLSQKRLKILVGREVDAYRKSKNMIKPLREGRRCWTLTSLIHGDAVGRLPARA